MGLDAAERADATAHAGGATEARLTPRSEELGAEGAGNRESDKKYNGRIARWQHLASGLSQLAAAGST